MTTSYPARSARLLCHCRSCSTKPQALSASVSAEPSCTVFTRRHDGRIVLPRLESVQYRKVPLNSRPSSSRPTRSLSNASSSVPNLLSPLSITSDAHVSVVSPILLPVKTDGGFVRLKRKRAEEDDLGDDGHPFSHTTPITDNWKDPKSADGRHREAAQQLDGRYPFLSPLPNIGSAAESEPSKRLPQRPPEWDTSSGKPHAHKRQNSPLLSVIDAVHSRMEEPATPERSIVSTTSPESSFAPAPTRPPATLRLTFKLLQEKTDEFVSPTSTSSRTTPSDIAEPSCLNNEGELLGPTSDPNRPQNVKKKRRRSASRPSPPGQDQAQYRCVMREIPPLQRSRKQVYQTLAQFESQNGIADSGAEGVVGSSSGRAGVGDGAEGRTPFRIYVHQERGRKTGIGTKGERWGKVEDS